MLNEPLSLPPGVDRASFLRDYWQRRPLLMRSAMQPGLFELSPDELAGLACEPEFESRLLIQRGEAQWDLLHGPFEEAVFAALPETHWTLLVQDVDKYVPAVGRLIEAFDFVPSWRIDDIMISYAADQGGVGPHTDAYDVFLMQASGRRRWRISTREYTEADLLPGLEQRILARFDTEQEWVLEPGDVLYLPPGVAHWGIAEGECMTYSLGFRAPSQQELAADWFQHLVSLATDRRLQDPPGIATDSLAELTGAVQDSAADLLRALPGADSEAFRSWLGCHLTEPKPQFQILPPEQEWDGSALADWLEQGRGLARHPCARLAWRAMQDGRVELFCQGSARVLPDCTRQAVQQLAQRRRFDAGLLRSIAHSAGGADLLLSLLNEGVLEPAEDT